MKFKLGREAQTTNTTGNTFEATTLLCFSNLMLEGLIYPKIDEGGMAFEPYTFRTGVHNAKAEECTTYMRQNIKNKYWRGWVTWRLLFLMNTNTSETT